MSKCRTQFGWVVLLAALAVLVAFVGCGGSDKGEVILTPTPITTPDVVLEQASAAPPGTVSSPNGEVLVQKLGGETWLEASAGMKLEAGDRIRTGSDGTVVLLFFDGSVMEVGPGSEIAVIELDMADTGSTLVRLRQAVGNTVSRVERLVDSASRYEVETPAGAAVVRGTIFKLWVGIDGYTEIDGEKGGVWFSAGGEMVLVTPGMRSGAWPGGVPFAPWFIGSPTPSPEPTSSPTPTPSTSPSPTPRPPWVWLPHRYMLSVNAEGCCAVRLDGEVLDTPCAFAFAPGREVLLEVETQACCEVQEWIVNGVAASANPLTVAMYSDCHVAAVCGVRSHSLSVSSKDCCPVRLNGVEVGISCVGDFVCGSEVELEADVSECCDFDGWLVDGCHVAGNPIAVPMGSDHNAVATCHVPSYTMTVASDGCCPVRLNGVEVGMPYVGDFVCGSEVELEADVSECCDFDGWLVDGCYVAGNPVVVPMGSDHNAVATCHVPSYTMTVASDGCCPVRLNGKEVGTPYVCDYVCGTEVLLEADVSECCEFGGWTVDGQSVGGNPVAVVMDVDHDVAVDCTMRSYTVTVASNGCCPVRMNGVVVPTPYVADFVCGTELVLEAEVAQCCEFGGWTVDGEDVAGNPITVVVDSDHDAAARCLEPEPGTQLVVLLDASSSMKSDDWELQKAGLSNAVLDSSCMPRGEVELTVIIFCAAKVEGSYVVEVEVVVDHVVITEESAQHVAGVILSVDRPIGLKHTPLASAICEAREQLTGDHQIECARRIINISTNGVPNVSLDAEYGHAQAQADAVQARDAAIDAGVAEVCVEGVGSLYTEDLAWLRDSLVYPQPGHLAPPDWTPGWVCLVGSVGEFSEALCR